MASSDQDAGLDWSYGVPDPTVRAKFRSREPYCADFFRNEAERYYRIGACTVITVWADRAHTEVAGFVTFSPSGLRSQKYEKAIEEVLGKEYVLGGKTFPCWLIGHLARNSRDEFAGLGERMMWLALTNIVRRAHHGSGACILVEAGCTRLINYYRNNFGFSPLLPTMEKWEENPRGTGSRMLMYRSVKRVSAFLAEEGVSL